MSSVHDIKAALARNALAVCQTYLPNGRKSGNHWIVGDVTGAKGGSLYVRLNASGGHRAGQWTDAATGQHGDLIDIIQHSLGLRNFGEAMDEARSFLSLPRPKPEPEPDHPTDRSAAARRLFKSARLLIGSPAELYLRGRSITGPLDYPALRFHPRCYHRPEIGPLQTFPALLAAITDLSGAFTGLHRTWLSEGGLGKAPILEPRRVMGNLIGHAVRFGVPRDVLIAGEGIETVLSLRSVLPWIPAAAGLTANHLKLMRLPIALERLYIALDNDPAGDMAWQALSETARAQGIQPLPLIPALDDWNSDLHRLGLQATRSLALRQLLPIDLPHDVSFASPHAAIAHAAS